MNIAKNKYLNDIKKTSSPAISGPLSDVTVEKKKIGKFEPKYEDKKAYLEYFEKDLTNLEQLLQKNQASIKKQ